MLHILKEYKFAYMFYNLTFKGKIYSAFLQHMKKMRKPILDGDSVRTLERLQRHLLWKRDFYFEKEKTKFINKRFFAFY
jgi:hypothetical protein